VKNTSKSRTATNVECSYANQAQLLREEFVVLLVSRAANKH